MDDPDINLSKLDEAMNYLLTKNGTVLLFCDLDLLYKLKQNLSHFDFRWEYVCYKNNCMPCGNTRPISNVEYIAVFQRKDAKATELAFNPYETGIVKEPYKKKNVNKEHSTREMTKRDVDENKSGKRYVKQSLEMRSKCNLPKDERTEHTFQKDREFLQMLIRIHSNENALVCDSSAGSGSTLEAAKKTQRRAVGFEIDERWCEVARENWKSKYTACER